VSKTCTTVEIAKMFKGLMKQELEHAELFEKLAKPETLPEVNETCTDDPKAVLKESLAREKRASAFYASAVAESTTPRIKEVFEAIRNVENTHIELDEAVAGRYC
jgi:rubrerythrin